MVKVWALIIALMALVAVGFGVLVSSEIDKLEKEFEETAISRTQFREVKLGASEDQVIGFLRVEPDTEEEELVDSIGGGKPRTMRCLYFNKAGHFASYYVFCFEDGRLKKKEDW